MSHAQPVNFKWAKQMEGGIQAEGFSIAVDALGNVYTTGYFEGTVDFDPGVGVFKISCGINISQGIYCK